MDKKRQIALLIFLILLFFTINYSFFDKLLINYFDEKSPVVVTRVIDGDTIIINGNKSLRFLGINSPEKGEKYYAEAKYFLENLVLNKTLELEFGKNKYDKYNRVLAYVYSGSKNINLELVENGFANFYFPSGKDIHYQEFKKAWENCVEKEKNLCEKSKDKCTVCIGIKEFDYLNEKIVFQNKCDFDCDLTKWKIKDEGRKNFVFQEFVLKSKNEVKINVGEGINTEKNLFWKNEQYVWTKSGDSLFLRDSDDKLVLWESY